MNVKALATRRNGYYLLAGVAGGLATFALSLIVYGWFMSSIDLGNVDYPVYFCSSLANGFFVTTVLRWGRFTNIGTGAAIGALLAVLTDVYFIGVAVAMFSTVTVWVALVETLIWAGINVGVGALTGWVLGRANTEEDVVTPIRVSWAAVFTRRSGRFAVAGIVGGVLAILLTAVLYGVILAPFLLTDGADVNGASLMLNANIPLFLIANISHGFLIAAVIVWGRFYKFWQGALAAVVVACFTDLYFGLRDAGSNHVGGIGEITVASAIQDTLIWMLLNLFLGALMSLILGRPAKKAASAPDPIAA